ncbi:HAUS augmin-like complex subunit 7 isoform X2 [Heteronotia binoei]|uniref:HAUS augmin-like complex subunit 7 isoform X2 n=1 Tax=Heteronotia binoei TaxID=13085 RepID=UPI00292CBADF|nr:HAUS augmin-like complex subunit 7 isoform X2 [Heteronotia binoei]
MAAVALYELLERLGCPALEGVFLSKPEDIQRLLCSPSPHRLDILEWICVSVYPPLQDQFSSLKESQTDMKIKDMAKLGSDLMLCRVDDLDLIEGKASVEKQLCFLSRLVAVIPTRESIEISDSGSFSSTFSRSRLPVASHERTLLEVSKELEETAAALQELRSQCSFLSGNPDGTEQPLDSATALQTLKLAVSDFGQLLVAFEQVYESEWKRHCERPAPRLSPCGPLFKAVQRDLSLSIQELTSLAQVMETSENIVTVVDRQQEEKLAWRGSAKATLPSKLEELQRKYKAIRATLHKLSNTEATVSL